MKIFGKENIKQYLLNSITKNTSKKLFSILIGKPIVYYYGEDFAEVFMRKRTENNIFLKSLRLSKNIFDIGNHKNYSQYNKEVKYIKSNDFNNNIFLYDDIILIIDMQKCELEYIENKIIFKQYMKKFNNLWDK